MRKLKDLLPLVRSQLISNENKRGMWHVCIAAAEAAEKGTLVYNEYFEFHNMIALELKGCVFLRTHLINEGKLEWNIECNDPLYWPVRDAWLDELQAKLEKENR